MKKIIGVVALATLALAGAHALDDAHSARAQVDPMDDSVTILHAIPGVTVDLVIDGELVVPGFDAGDTQDLTPLAGMTINNIEARAAGGSEVVIGPIDSFDVPDSGSASVVVHLDAEGEPKLTTFFNQATPIEAGNGLLTVRHVAAAPPVSVSIDNQQALADIGNGEEGAVVLPAGMIDDAWITAGGRRVAAVPRLQLDEGSQLVVYIGGSLEQNDLAFYLQVISGSTINSTVPTQADGQPAPSVDDAAAGGGTDAPAADASADGTPTPEVVNTGLPIEIGGRSGFVLLLAALLLAFGFGALAWQQRIAGTPRQSS
jgi:hypothetical protein